MDYEEYDDFEQSWAPEVEYMCDECDDGLVFNKGDICKNCHFEINGDYKDYDEYDYGDISFADPGGRSALRAAGPGNPRNLPCPNCGEPDRLTPADRARGYQCDSCADALERGY